MYICLNDDDVAFSECHLCVEMALSVSLPNLVGDMCACLGLGCVDETMSSFRCRAGWTREDLCQCAAGVYCSCDTVGHGRVGGCQSHPGQALRGCAQGVSGNPSRGCQEGPSSRCGGVCVVRDVRHGGGRYVRGARRGRACEHGLRGGAGFAACTRAWATAGRLGARGCAGDGTPTSRECETGRGPPLTPSCPI